MKVINQKQRETAVKVVRMQCAVVTLLTLLGLLVSYDFALSVFTGAAISLIANMYFTVKVFRYSGALHSQQVAKSFYSGEAGKFVITLVCYAVAFKWLGALKEPTNAAGLLIASFLVQAAVWLIPLFSKKK